MPSYLYKNYFINILFAIIPISFIAGNLILNLNVLLLIISSLVFYGKDIFKIHLIFIDKLMLVFFSYVLFIGLFNNIYTYNIVGQSKDYLVIVKSILYLRFLIFYFIIRFLVVKNLFNFKIFFLTCSLSSLFVCLDLLYQFSFGYDIFGFEGNTRRLAGPFGDEQIAGSFLQRFSIFSFFSLICFSKINNKIILNILLILLFLLIMSGLMIAGNRMPMTMFILLSILILSFEKKIRKYLIFFLFCTTIGVLILNNFNTNFKKHLGNYKLRITESVVFFQAILIESKESKLIESSKLNHSDYFIIIKDKKIQIPNTYLKEFNSGFQTWKNNKYIGGGIKSYRKNCSLTYIINCGPHPHNYYLEILSELGLIGFLILLIMFAKILYDTFIKKYFLKISLQKEILIIPFMFLFFIEIMPIRTTGSFFTTANATYIFLIVALTVALSKRKKIN